MGHKRRGKRISRAVNTEGHLLVPPVKQGPVRRLTRVEVYATRPVGKSAQPMQRMLKQTKGARKWMNGLPTIHYSRDGYIWVGGHYIKGLNTKATGVTFKHDTNRAELRARAATARQRPKGVPGYVKGHTPRDSTRVAGKALGRKLWAERKKLEPQMVAAFEAERRKERRAQRGQ